MRNKKHIKVVKVFLSKNEIPPDIPQQFDRFPRMYLELFENKTKIKNDLVNIEYTYDNAVGPEKIENFEKTQNTVQEEKKPEIDSASEKKDASTQQIEPDKSPDKSPDKYANVVEDSNNLSSRLKQLLNDNTDDIKSAAVSDKKTPAVFATHPQQQTRKEEFKEPPSLAELQANGLYKGHNKTVNNLKDFNGGYTEQETDNKKREILFKFDLLKKSYPFSNIQDFSIHSDLQSMEVAYNDCVRRLSLDSSVEEYKKFLIGGFMLVEYVFGNFLGLEMQGFTQQQIISMNSYEKLLIELGEKSYVPKGSNWPVEVRLVFMIIINAAVFLVSKIIMKKTGANLMGMMNNMNASTSEKKKKMKGPDLQEI